MVYELRPIASYLEQWGWRWLSRLQELLLPPRCIACGSSGQRNLQAPPDSGLLRIAADLCAHCQAQLPLNHIACRRCALPLPGTQPGLICGRCLKRPPHYQASWCACKYAYPVTHLVRRLKYGGALATSRVLGELLAQHLRMHRSDSWPECFIPMPLHTRRFQERGYNQVIELGRHLERALGIPMRTDLVARVRHTPEQAGLSRSARRKNLRRAFVTTSPALPKHLAVLDDVITTGSTVNEISRVLKHAGVRHIEVWGLARAVMNMKKST